MEIELAPRCGARTVRVSSGSGGLSIAVTLVSPLIAVLLTHYLSTEEKHRTTFALPIPQLDVSHGEDRPSTARPALAASHIPPPAPTSAWTTSPVATPKQDQAQRLISQAEHTPGDPAGQFIMLRLARDAAIEAGDRETAFRAIDVMAGTFGSDGSSMKMAALAKYAAAAHKPAQHKTIAEQASKLAAESAAQNHLMVATQLGKLALAEAKKAVDQDLLAKVRGQLAELAGQTRALSSR